MDQETEALLGESKKKETEESSEPLKQPPQQQEEPQQREEQSQQPQEQSKEQQGQPQQQQEESQQQLEEPQGQEQSQQPREQPQQEQPKQQLKRDAQGRIKNARGHRLTAKPAAIVVPVPAHPQSPLFAHEEEQIDRQRRYLFCCVCLFFLLLFTCICVSAYYIVIAQDKIRAYKISHVEQGSATKTMSPTTTTTTPVVCPFSSTPGRLKGETPKSVEELRESCLRCVNPSRAKIPRYFCQKWCANADKGDRNSDPWMVFSRRNTAREDRRVGNSLDCIFESPLATKAMFGSGFACDEEVFLGLDKIAAASDPNVKATNMFEVRVVSSDERLLHASSNPAPRTGGEIRKGFFIDSLFIRKEEPRFCRTPEAAPDFASTGRPLTPPSNCDPDVKGGYWKGTSGDMTLCAACCRRSDFGLVFPKDKKVVEVLFRHVRCLEDEKSPTEEEFRFQLKIPPVLECFDDGATNLVHLETPMGKTKIIGGKNKHRFWCSPSGGMKILERNLAEDSWNSSRFPDDQKCIFEAKNGDWNKSKYKGGFGCANQFFIGTDNAKNISDATLAHRKPLKKGVLKLKVVYGKDEKQFEEKADISNINDG